MRAPAAGPGPRIVDVAAARLTHWVAGFAARHGEYTCSPGVQSVILVARDGATAAIEPPFPPLPDGWDAENPLDHVVAHAMRKRVVGVLLVRLGGYAAGVFDGPELLTSKVGSRQVHGRSAAGGWSQQRFARRREGQVRVALSAAGDAAGAVLLPLLPKLDAVVTGGDRQALRTVLADSRLSALTPLVMSRVLEVPDPKARVLRESIGAATAIRVTVTDP